jgi:hypothetical protein
MEHAARTEERRGAYRVVVRRPERKRPLDRPMHKCEGNTKMEHQEVRWGVEWTDVAQDRDRWQALVKAVMNLRVPYDAGNFLTS